MDIQIQVYVPKSSSLDCPLSVHKAYGKINFLNLRQAHAIHAHNSSRKMGPLQPSCDLDVLFIKRHVENIKMAKFEAPGNKECDIILV